MPTIEQLLVEWESDWLVSIKTQIYDLHFRKEVHDGLRAALEAQGHPDRAIFDEAFHRMYIEAQVMAIRRQADNDSRTRSMQRLIGQLECYRRKFTRVWYVARWLRDVPPDESDLHSVLANRAFDKFCDTPGGDCLGARSLQRDRQALAAMTEQVVAYANEVVAHSQAVPSYGPVTYRDLDRAVQQLGEMLKRYYLLITQNSLLTAAPTIPGDWMGPFRGPLVQPG